MQASVHSAEAGDAELFRVMGALPQRLAAALPAAIWVEGTPLGPCFKLYPVGLQAFTRALPQSGGLSNLSAVLGVGRRQVPCVHA